MRSEEFVNEIMFQCGAKEKLISVTEFKIRSKEEQGLNGASLQLKMKRLRLKMKARKEVKAERKLLRAVRLVLSSLLLYYITS